MGDPVMRLHHFAHSSASYRVRTVLALKGIAVEYVPVDMFSLEQQGPEYGALNPQRMLPCLELPDGTVLAQSLAIIDYLDHLVPDPAIYPSNAVTRAQARALALYIACETAPLQAKVLRRALMEDFGLDEAQDMRWVTRWIRRGLAQIEGFLAQRAVQSPFAFGDTPGIVDIVVVPQMRNADRLGIAIDDFVGLNALRDQCERHPAFAAAHPDRWI